MIVKEQHDLNAINVDPGSVDRALQNALGMWDAYEMGISQQEVQRRIREADTPERRAEILADLRQRAQRRADLAVINGRVAVMTVGESWHGLGVQVEKAATATEAMELASLDYEVEKHQAKVTIGGETVEVPGVYCVGKKIETPDGPVRSVFPGVSVSKAHELFQNRECFEFVDKVLGSVNGAHYLTAGAIDGGRKTFITAQMPQWAEPVLGDEVHLNIVMTNAHDATEAVCLMGTEERPVCANTRRLALRNAKRMYRFRHARNMRQRIEEARSALGLTVQSFEQFAEVAGQMPLVNADPEEFADAYLDNLPRYAQISRLEVEQGVDWLVGQMDLLTDDARHAAAQRFERMIARRKSIRDDILSRNESDTNTAPGTVWGIYNACTEHANHGLRYIGSQGKQRETRFKSLIDGRADELNQAAFVLAEECVADAF